MRTDGISGADWMRHILIFLALALFMTATSFPSGTWSACANTANSAGIWTLSGNLTCTGHGITISSADVMIDMAGYTVDGDETTADYAFNINPGLNNTTIMNGKITDFGRGVYGANLTYLTVKNMSFSGTAGASIRVGAAGATDIVNNINITNTSITSATGRGIWIDSGVANVKNISITNNFVTLNTINGIQSSGGDANITGNTVTSNTGVAIYVVNGGGTKRISNNIITATSTNSGIQVDAVNGSAGNVATISGNTITGCLYCIGLYTSSQGHIVANNTIANGTGASEGIISNGLSINNLITGNNITNVTYGISMDSVSYNNATYNKISNTTDCIKLKYTSSGVGNIFSHNTCNLATGSAYSLDRSSSGVMNNNTATNSYRGIDLHGVNTTNITNSRIINMTSNGLVYGSEATPSYSLIIDNVTINNITGHGIDWTAKQVNTSSVVSNCVISNIGANGINVNTNLNNITGLVLTNITENGFRIGTDGYADVNDSYIYNNTVINASKSAYFLSGATSSNNLFKDNIARDSTGNSIKVNTAGSNNTFNGFFGYNTTKNYFILNEDVNFTNGVAVGYNAAVGIINWTDDFNLSNISINSTNMLLYPTWVSTNITQGAATITLRCSEPGVDIYYASGFPTTESAITTYNRTETCVAERATFNVTSFSGYKASWIFSPWCYQESANASTICGGLDTGAYGWAGSWTNPENTTDGNWSTYGQSFDNGYVYINYTKPAKAWNTSLWAAMDDITLLRDNVSFMAHLSTYGCWNQPGSPLQLRLYTASVGTRVPGTECWSDTLGWVSTSFSGGVELNQRVYEEGMWWYIPPTIAFTNPTPSNGSTNYTNSQILNFTSDIPMASCLMSIDGNNQTGTVSADGLSCSYTMLDTDYRYNDSYNIIGFANLSGTYYQTNETRAFDYFGCGYLNSTATLLSNITTADANYPTCIIYNASNAALSCKGYNITSTFGHAIGLNPAIDIDNTTTRDCILDDGINYIDPLDEMLINGSYHSIINTTYLAPSAIEIIAGCTGETSNALDNISCSNAAGCFLRVHGDALNTSINRLQHAFIALSQGSCANGTMSLTNSIIDKGGIDAITGGGSLMNLTIINTTISNSDAYAYEDTYKTSVNMTDVTIFDSGYGIKMESDPDDGNGTYYKELNNIHFYNITSNKTLQINASDDAQSVIALNNLILDSTAGNYVNYSNISQNIYLAGPLTDGRYYLNTSTNASLPANTMLFGKILTMATGGMGAGDTTFHWLDSQLGAIDEDKLSLMTRAAGVWTVVNDTPDTSGNSLYMAYADPWSGGDYALLEDSNGVTVSIFNPTNTSIKNTPTTFLWKCSGSLASYSSNLIISNYTGANATYPSINNTNLTDSLTLLDGFHTLNASCANATYYSSKVIQFTTDSIEPNISISNPANISYGYSSILLNLSTNDSTSPINKTWYNYGGANITYTAPGNVSFPDGSINLTAWTNDSAGNINTTSIIFYVDASQPNVSFVSPINKSYNTSVLINISANDTNLDSVWFFNGTANQSYTVPVYINYADGGYTVIAYANDTLANLKTSSPVSFSVDKTPPVIGYITYTDVDLSSKYPVLISWIAANVSANDSFTGVDNITIRLYKNGILSNTQISGTSPFWINWTLLTPAIYKFNATAFDVSGNLVNLNTRTVTIVAVDPPITYIVSPISATDAYTVSAVCDSSFPTNTIDLYVDGSIEDTQVCADNVACPLTYPLQDCAAINLTVSCTDGAVQQVNFSSMIIQEPEYASVTPANGLSISNSTPLNFSMTWTCTPASTDVLIASVPTYWPMSCAGLTCSYNNSSWTPGHHLWSIRTGLATGGYVSSPSYNFQVAGLPWNSSANFTITKIYTYSDFTDYVQAFYEDYGVLFLGILSYALAWLVTQRYPQTMIAGGLGMLVLFFINGNPIALVFSITSIVVGLVYKYIVG